MEYLVQGLQALGIVAEAREDLQVRPLTPPTPVSCKHCLKGHKCRWTGKDGHTPSPAKVKVRVRA